jgi:hypothetical protein
MRSYGVIGSWWSLGAKGTRNLRFAYGNRGRLDRFVVLTSAETKGGYANA